jgi:hypothetical protein
VNNKGLHSENRKDLATFIFLAHPQKSVPGEKLSLEKWFFENAFFFFDLNSHDD